MTSGKLALPLVIGTEFHRTLSAETVSPDAVTGIKVLPFLQSGQKGSGVYGNQAADSLDLRSRITD